MIVIFKNPHSGVGGPIEALPEDIKEYLSRIEGLDGGLYACVGRISVISGRGYWVSVDTDRGWILLMKKTADPTAMVSRWKLIEFEEV